MKIYTLFTESHTRLLYEYFLPTIHSQENVEVVIKKIPQYCSSAEYGKDGWFQTMIKKVEYHIQACKENYGQTFIYSDCDVQFFEPFINIAINELADYDIACQDDVYPYKDRKTYCAGFFICRANDKTINLFNKILSDMLIRGQYYISYNDQAALNENISMVNHKTLSHKFYTIAQTTNQLWEEDYNVKIPDDIVAHHANWTHGISNKIKLLDLVKNNKKL
jgi:hypothetical protein